jgi:hypothetical protein
MATRPISSSNGRRSTPPDTFDRKLSDDFAAIQSTCEMCGEVLVGSVSDGLPKREVEHFLACAKKPVSSSQSSSQASSAQAGLQKRL